VYAGWITVATITNVAAVLVSVGFTGAGIPAEAWAAAVLLVGLAIASSAAWLTRDAAYGLVVAWAYAGIAVKEADVLPVALVAGTGAALMLGIAVVSAARRPAPTGVVGPPATPATRTTA
jgi:hypothetical protein